MRRLALLLSLLIPAQSAGALSPAQESLLTSISAAKASLKPEGAPESRRLADLLEIEAGARQASSPEEVGRWQARFDSWARKDSLRSSHGPPETETILGQQKSAEDLKAGRNFGILEALKDEKFSAAYDGAKIPSGPPAAADGAPKKNPAALQGGKAAAKPKKPKSPPPVSPLSNPVAAVEAVSALLPAQNAKNLDRKRNKRITVSKESQREIAKIAVQEAVRQGLDPLFVLSFIAKESAFYAKAWGSLGEAGLMQLMPQTAKDIAEDLPDIESLLRKDTYRLKDSVKSCDRLSEKLIDEGKLIINCEKAPAATPAAAESSQKPLKADYAVTYLDLHDPQTNIRLGTINLKGLWDEFSRIDSEKLCSVDPHKRKDIKAVISAHNAGARAVAKTLAKYGRPPASTEEYVDSFLNDFYAKLSRRFQKIAKAPKP